MQLGEGLNDNMWHTLHIKRRADHLEIWIDDNLHDVCKYGSNSLRSGNTQYHHNHLCNFFFFFLIFVGHMSICGATDTPDCFGLLMMSPLGFKA